MSGVLFLALSGSAPAAGGNHWSFTGFLGGAYNLSTPLRIHQSGEGDVHLSARYDSKSFEAPIYYAVRFGRWKGDRAWEVELIHHKLFLRNRPETVRNFSISHGYNLILFNRAFDFRGWLLHLGAGLVLAHPESTVRRKKLSQERGIFSHGYYLSGPAAQLAVGKRFYWNEAIFAAVEGKLTAAYNHLPVADGSADLSNVALHGLFGLGADF
jgi:hypothetical protein